MIFSSNSLKYFVGITVAVLTICLVFLFVQYNMALNKAYESSKTIKKINTQNFALNIEKLLKKEFQNALNDPFNIEDSQIVEGNDLLSLFVGHEYAFVFIVAKDTKGKYRYIFDGATKKEEKGEYLQKFDPASDIWENVWNTQTPQWKTQDSINDLWSTYLYPLVIDGKTTAILAFDFSTHEYELIKTIFLPIKKYLLATPVLLSIFLLFVYIFGFLFYKQREEACVDSLTGLHNRHYLNNISESLDLKDISIALIDLDHFKRINDSFGHRVGDKVLHDFSLRLEELLRPKDILIRYGGEEFLLFLHKDSNDNTNTEELIQSIYKKISTNPIKIDNNEIFIKASIGFNTNPYFNRSLSDAIDVADKMLYVAKTSGRNKIEIFKEEMLEKETVFGPREVSSALKEGRVAAYFQPIADAKSGRIVKYEMLIRIFAKDGALISPIKFLSNIKSNSAYRDMSKFMLDQAIKTIQQHKISVSVNFDVGDFLDKTLYEQIYDTLVKNKTLTSKLTLELLEDRQVDNFENVASQINKLQSLGVSIAVDDFGTGYSTFSYLLALNPDILKIDGFLIRKLDTSSQARIIVDAIIKLCKELGIQIVAEFVENESIRQYATAMGIDFLQGYAIGKPSQEIQR